MNEKLSLVVSEDDKDVAYLYLPGHPGRGALTGAVRRQVRLSSLLAYDGPDIYLDLDAQGRLIGLEILADDGINPA